MKTIAEFIRHLAGIAVLLTAGIVIYANILTLISKDPDVRL